MGVGGLAWIGGGVVYFSLLFSISLGLDELWLGVVWSRTACWVGMQNIGHAEQKAKEYSVPKKYSSLAPGSVSSSSMMQKLVNQNLTIAFLVNTRMLLPLAGIPCCHFIAVATRIHRFKVQPVRNRRTWSVWPGVLASHLTPRARLN